MWKKISPFFESLFDIFVPHNRCVVEFTQSSRAFVIERPQVQLQNGEWTDDFMTVSFKLYNVLLLHLSKPSIRKQLQWRTVLENNFDGQAHYVWEYLLVGKVMRDGFRLKNGKNLELTVWNTISIKSGSCSRNLSDVIQISCMEEDCESVWKHNQVTDLDVTLLRECGIPDVDSGVLVGVQIQTVADSKWTEVTTGHDGANTDYPFLWSGMTKAEFRNTWETVHVRELLHCFVFFNWTKQGMYFHIKKFLDLNT